MYNNGLIYFELRYNSFYYDQDNEQEVIDLVKIGLQEGYKKFRIYSTQILCMIRRHSSYSKEIVQLAINNKKHINNMKHMEHIILEYIGSVVSIDVAGNEQLQFDQLIIDAYQYAYENNIHRTIHTENPRDF